MRALRASFAGLGSLVLVVGLGAPASAGHTTMTAAWEAPGTDPDTGVVVAGPVGVDLAVAFSAPLVDSNVKEWQVQLREPDGEPVGVLCSLGYPGLGTDLAHVAFTWDSRSHPSGTVNTECEEGAAAHVDPARPLANGRFVLRLRARDHLLATEWHDDDFDVRVNNPPAAPEGVAAVFDPDAQQVTVSWSANREPDLRGYTVQQCRTDAASESCAASAWTTVAEHEADDVDATAAVGEPGAYRYRVVARRPDWSGTATLTSEPGAAPSPIVLEADAPNAGSGQPDGPVSGTDGSVTTLPADDADPSSGSTSGSGVERRRGLQPRLVQRSGDLDFGFDEALPYGAGRPERTRSRPGDVLVGPGGSGNLLVPVAGGLAVFVFAMQLRYLGRRAALVAAGGTGGGELELLGDDALGPARAEDAAAPSVPKFRPLLGGSADDGPGSFIANWRRWLPDDRV